jgi:hypothetical protein
MRRFFFVTLALVGLATPLMTLQGTAAAAGGATAGRAARTTLLATNFDHLARGQVTPTEYRSAIGGSNNSTWDYDDSSIVASARGGNAYRVTLEKGTIRGNPSGNHGIVIYVPLKRQVDNACIRYNVKFDGNFDWSLGGKLPGLEGVAPGVSPSKPSGGGNAGELGWSGRMMWLTPKSYSWAGPVNQMVQYMYNPNQAGYYGDNVRWNKSFTAGKWHRLRMCYVMNTVGKADGILRTWLDGAQVLNITHYVYRLRNDVHISHLAWEIFRGGGDLSWAGKRDDYIDFDNLRISTRG